MKMFRSAAPVLFWLMIGLAAPPISADIYKYTDADGVVRFTDDLAMVPADQRSMADEYGEITTPDPEAPAPALEPVDPVGTLDTEADVMAASERLHDAREALEEERARLVSLQDQLNSVQKVTHSKAEAKKHMDRLARFREEARAYEEKRQAYEQDLARYNAQIDALNRKAAEPGVFPAAAASEDDEALEEDNLGFE